LRRRMVLVDPLLEDAHLHAARSVEEEHDPSPDGILARDLLRSQGHSERPILRRLRAIVVERLPDWSGAAPGAMLRAGWPDSRTSLVTSTRGPRARASALSSTSTAR